MNIIQEIHKLFDEVVDGFEEKYGPGVRGNVEEVVNDVKGQAQQLLVEAGHDVEQDVAEVKSDVHDATATAGQPAASEPAAQ